MQDHKRVEGVKLSGFFEPVEVVKSGDEPEKRRLLGKVRGIATVEVPDKVKGDIVDLDTIRLDYLLKSGVFTHEHPRGVLNTIGYPVSAKVIDYTTPDGKATRALEVEGYMYLDDDVGAMIYHKASIMHEAGGDRQFGWSLEGPGLVRNGDVALPTRVVHHHEPKAIAICLEPAVEYALWDVAASATAAAGDPGTLEQVLHATAALRDRTQLFHWNVVGPTFSQLHEMFGAQYDDLVTAVDDVAERIRQSGPKIDPFAAAPAPAPDSATEMLVELAKSNRDLAALCDRTVRAAEAAGDAATVDLLGKRAGVHSKAAWVLESTAVIEPAKAFVANLAKSAQVVNAQRGGESDQHRHTVMLLKSFPTLTWAQGEEIVGRIRSAVHNVMHQKGNQR